MFLQNNGQDEKARVRKPAAKSTKRHNILFGDILEMERVDNAARRITGGYRQG